MNNTILYIFLIVSLNLFSQTHRCIYDTTLLNKLTDSALYSCKVIETDVVKKKISKNNKAFIKLSKEKNIRKANIVIVQDTLTKDFFTIISLDNKKQEGEKLKKGKVYRFYLKKYYKNDFIIRIGYFFVVEIEGVTVYVPMGFYTGNIYLTSNLEGIYFHN